MQAIQAALQYRAQVQPSIHADSSSVFNAVRGGLPIKFTLTRNGAPTCELPPATIAVVRTAGTPTGPIDPNEYIMPSDTGASFRTTDCQYVYNVDARSLGPGAYRATISIDGATVGSGTFNLQ